MARKVFFSFHYERDAWRASQVRNSGVVGKPIDAEGFIDKAEWESIKLKGDREIQKWIDGQMFGTSVTVILIGRETSDRDWVRYELKKSIDRGNGIVGVTIHSIRNEHQQIDYSGSLIFGDLLKDRYGQNIPLSNIYKVYDWNINNGRANLTTWIEEAAKNAGK